MQNQNNSPAQANEQIRDARDLLTRLYRDIGISAVAAALEVRKEKPQAARPAVAVLQRSSVSREQSHAA